MLYRPHPSSQATAETKPQSQPTQPYLSAEIQFPLSHRETNSHMALLFLEIAKAEKSKKRVIRLRLPDFHHRAHAAGSR